LKDIFNQTQNSVKNPELIGEVSTFSMPASWNDRDKLLLSYVNIAREMVQLHQLSAGLNWFANTPRYIFIRALGKYHDHRQFALLSIRERDPYASPHKSPLTIDPFVGI